jgi:type IV pilus assembly protein PilX
MFKHARPIIRYARSAARQRGSALIFALVFLLVMTVIGVTGMQGTTQQEKMAGNMRNRNLAFQAAEAALRAGEMYVDPVIKAGVCNRPAPAAFDGTKGLLQPQTTGGDDGAFWMTWDWENISCPNSPTDTSCPDDGTTLAEVAEQPRYVIEDISSLDPVCSACYAGTPPGCYCYRITARGVGGTTDAIVILQSTYQWNSAKNNCNPLSP